MNLEVLSEIDARELLARHVGAQRLDREPQAATELLRCCGGLPLALNIAAARVAGHEAFPLAVFADELSDRAARLDGLDAGDTTVSLRAVFSCSYNTLRPEVATVFGLLGLVTAPDVGLPAVASLIGVPPEQAAILLRDLENAYLVLQRMPNRYQMHDLRRAEALTAWSRAVELYQAQHRTSEADLLTHRMAALQHH